MVPEKKDVKAVQARRVRVSRRRQKIHKTAMRATFAACNGIARGESQDIFLTFRNLLPAPICRVEPRSMNALLDVRCMTLRTRCGKCVEAIKDLADWMTIENTTQTSNR